MKHISLVLAFLFVVVPPVFGEQNPSSWSGIDVPDGYSLVDRIVAQVEGQLVTLYEVDKAVETNLTLGAGSPQAGIEQRRKEALQALIDEQLLLSEAQKLNLLVTADEVEQHLQATRAQNNWTMDDLRENIARLGMTLDEYREVTRKEKTKSKIIGVKVGSRISVSASEVQRILDSEYGGGKFEQEARVSILVRTISPNWTQAQVDEAKRYAVWLREQAAAAPNRFGDLARKFSEHEATRYYGGDLGYFRKGSIALPLLEEAAFSVPIGEVSQVLETAQGLMIVAVTDRRQGAVEDVEGLRNAVFQRLYTEARLKAYQDWLEELRATAFIKTRLGE